MNIVQKRVNLYKKKLKMNIEVKIPSLINVASQHFKTCMSISDVCIRSPDTKNRQPQKYFEDKRII